MPTQPRGAWRVAVAQAFQHIKWQPELKKLVALQPGASEVLLCSVYRSGSKDAFTKPLKIEKRVQLPAGQFGRNSNAEVGLCPKPTHAAHFLSRPHSPPPALSPAVSRVCPPRRAR